MRMLAGVGSEVHFTNLSQACVNSLLETFGKTSKKVFPPDIADVFFTTKGVLDLIEAIGVSLDQVCLLDPKAEHELSPNDTYTSFLFGVGVDQSTYLRRTDFNQGDLG